MILDLAKHNTKNIETVVGSLKADTVKVDTVETRGDDNTAKIIKPAKVPTWTESLSLETYIKQIETWSEINKDVPENTKYQDHIESLKINKDVKNLPRFVGEQS